MEKRIELSQEQFAGTLVEMSCDSDDDDSLGYDHTCHDTENVMNSEVGDNQDEGKVGRAEDEAIAEKDAGNKKLGDDEDEPQGGTRSIRTKKKPEKFTRKEAYAAIANARSQERYMYQCQQAQLMSQYLFQQQMQSIQLIHQMQVMHQQFNQIQRRFKPASKIRSIPHVPRQVEALDPNTWVRKHLFASCSHAAQSRGIPRQKILNSEYFGVIRQNFSTNCFIFYLLSDALLML